MASRELRTSGPLQAAVVALALGFLLRGTPGSDPANTWPYVVAGYGILAAIVPWLAGGYGRGEFSLRYWMVLGGLLAAPVATSAQKYNRLVTSGPSWRSGTARSCPAPPGTPAAHAAV